MKSLPLLAVCASSIVSLAPSLLGADRAARADGVLCALGPTSEGYLPLLDMPASTATSRDVKRLISALCPKGCGQVGVFRNPTSPNAMTMAVGGHGSKIAYKAAFVEGAVHAYGPGATVGILAHEIGHHVDANVPASDWMSASWGSELRADAWAGCALAKAGGKPADVKAAFQALATYPSASHPAWAERTVALQKGFRSCGGPALAELDPILKKVPGQSGSAGSAGGPRGCALDNECRIGRVCLDGKCEDGALRRSCAKDVDCPGTQICAGAGICQAPAGPGPTPRMASGPERVASSALPATCHDRCGDDEETCSGRADRVLRECKTALVADQRYKDCTCPHWPAGRLDCFQFCQDTFDKAQACQATHEMAGTACLSVAARCASDCN